MSKSDWYICKVNGDEYVPFRDADKALTEARAEIERLTALVVLLRDAGVYVLMGATPGGGVICHVGRQRLRVLGDAVCVATTAPSAREDEA